MGLVLAVPKFNGQSLLSEILGKLFMLLAVSCGKRIDLERHIEPLVQDLLDERSTRNEV